MPGADIAVYKCDLSSLKSVRECAGEINEKEERIDVLINNAGVMMCPYSKGQHINDVHTIFVFLYSFHLFALATGF